MLGTIGGILVIVGTTIKAIDDLTNKKLKYDLKIEIKAYREFVKNFKEVSNE